MIDGARPEGAGDERPSRSCPTCGSQYPLDFLVCPKDGTRLEVAGSEVDPLVGEIVAGSFLITGVLGEGGMGRVYEAEHTRLPRRFAVKVMLDEIAAHPDAVARFEREAQAIASIDSDHVLDVVDVDRAGGRPCMVTELLDGEELGNVLDRAGKLPIAEAIDICRQVCRGLAAAHAVGVVHRDLKPANLFLRRHDDGRPHVKILDFGIAKMADGSKLTRTGMILGTPAYMAPEQARGSADADARSDIYSTGAVLYRMLTGSEPFPAEHQAATLMRLLTEDTPRPRDVDPNIPERLDAIVVRAMARDPAARPATAQELDRLLAGYEDMARQAAIGTAVTIVHTPPTPIAPTAPQEIAAAPPPAAEERAIRPAGGRLLAMTLAIAFGVFSGTAVFVASANVFRAVTGRASIAETELALLALFGLVAAISLFLGGLRALLRRWRGGDAVARLGSGLRSALLWNLVPLGVLALGFRVYALVAPALPAEVGTAVEIGMTALPLLLGVSAFAIALRRARRA